LVRRDPIAATLSHAAIRVLTVPNGSIPLPGRELPVPTRTPTAAPGPGIESDDGGLPNGGEVNLQGASALAPDTDGDGASDLQEISSGTNPLGP
jgi:hypothetical protein